MNSHEPSPPPTAPSACPGCESLRQRLDEANRLMNAYRVKAHGLHSELDATLDRLSKSRASHKKIIAERDQTIAGLQVDIIGEHLASLKSDAEAALKAGNVASFLRFYDAAEGKRRERLLNDQGAALVGAFRADDVGVTSAPAPFILPAAHVRQ